MGKIKLLDEEVIHKIAAGEIIVSPVNALKELMENSLDSGASNISVVVKDGGHKLLQITDNGSGIDQDDLEILCQRFTTSKIASFEDLENVQTLGFRGEALASISHISQLQVKTKTTDSKTATIALYQDGNMLQKKPIAGVQGTQITVENLFYNVPLRSQALRAKSDSAEYQKILDVVSKYAIQYPGTFSCKRFQDSQPVVVPAGSQKDKIRKIYGNTISQEISELTVEPETDLGLIGVHGWVTGLNYSSKRSTPYILFINNRLVTSEPVTRAIRKVYHEHMPYGSAQAFVFLSISVEGKNIDVNMHPTKREVRFLYEDEIIDKICEKLEELLTSSNHARDYKVQSYITATQLPASPTSTVSHSIDPDSPPKPAPYSSTPAARYEYKLVRTDPRQQTLTSFAHKQTHPKPHAPSGRAISPTNSDGGLDKSSEKENDEDESSEYSALNDTQTEEPLQLRDLGLASIAELTDELKQNMSVRLLEFFTDHTFVGIVDKEKGLATVQHDVRLYIVEYKHLATELFYQLGLINFGNFGTIHLGDGLPLMGLLDMTASGIDNEGLEALFEFTPMLKDYFGIDIRQKYGNWFLVQVPLILPGYTPSVASFPQFASDLTAKVDWSNEKQCLQGVLLALASLHIPDSETDDGGIRSIFDTAKTSLVPSRELVSSVVEIASLPGLYRVFERC